MRIFVLDADVVENHDWETIRENYMILVRYDLSFADCEKINWTLDYPPSEAMKDIPMYPPYEEVIENYNKMMEQEE